MTYRVPVEKTVPYIYREAERFGEFPEVFATGFFVALVEWTCVEALAPYLEPGEGSLGVGIVLSHEAATPPGFEVTVDVTVTAAAGRQIEWEFVARDDVDVIGRGTHKRAVIDRARFDQRVAEKQARSRTA
jgi:fluoroacetyl-CoA thioesterase